MPEILLSNVSSNARSSLSQCDLPNVTLFDRSCKPVTKVNAYSPYVVGQAPSLQDQAILGELAGGNTLRQLANMSQCFGAEQVSNLAEFREHIAALSVGSIGTSTSVYMDRMNGLVKGLESYEKSLLSYREAARSGSLLQMAKKLEAHRAFERLQTSFQNEMKVITSRSNARRGTPLTRPERGINIARSSRHADKLYVANQAQAHNLVKLTRHAKLLGNGLAVVDFGSRIGSIHTTHTAGGNWHREMFVESASFAAGATSSIVAVKGGLMLLAAFTPVGLVGLIVGGLAIAGTAAAGSYFADRQVAARAGGWYDTIMEWLSSQ